MGTQTTGKEKSFLLFGANQVSARLTVTSTKSSSKIRYGKVMKGVFLGLFGICGGM